MRFSQGNQVRLIGGRLALDFANTAEWSAENTVKDEKLIDWDDVALWLLSVGLAEMRPEPIDELIELRSLVRSCFLDLLDGQPDSQNVRKLFIQVGASPGAGLSQRIALSAASLLLDPNESGRIKMCHGHDCGWLFVDESARNNRQWCAMDICGNREKARRHYKKVRGALQA